MRERLNKITDSLFLILLLPLISGCIPIVIPHPVPAETEEIDYPNHYFTRITLTPTSHPDRVDAFAEAVSKADKNIMIVPASNVFEHAFPNREVNNEFMVGELLHPEAHSRIKAIGIRFIVVLNSYQEEWTHEGFGPPLAAVGSGEGKIELLAGVINLEQPNSHKYIQALAHGQNAGVWYGPVIVGNAPMIERSAMAELANRVIAIIRQTSFEQPVKITLLAGEWESGKLRYTEDHALEWLQERTKEMQERAKEMQEMQERASQGDPDAQYNVFLFMKDEYTEPAVAWEWLCKAADQGYKKAQEEVGYWHNKTNWERARPLFERLWLRKAGIQADNRVAYMWYNIAANGDPDRLRTISDLFSGKLTEEEIAEADDMIRNWKPGQCPTPYQ